MRVIEEPKHGDVLESLNTPYPTRLEVVGEDTLYTTEHNTTYGYVIRGSAVIEARGPVGEGGAESIVARAKLGAGGYFSLPGRLKVEPEQGALVALIQRYGYRGLLQYGVREEVGRLSYIDGCSDTLLIAPARLGDPCFNHLHFPRGIVQTQHTHPTIRVGIVAAGRGSAFRLKSDGYEGWELPLRPGVVFILEPQELHSFRTDRSGEEMDVIAYHPDSDWGPTDAIHPMRNRTYIGNQLNTLGA